MNNNVFEMKSLMERMGDSIIPNDIKQIEDKVIRLVEERSVAGTPYRHVIKQIVNYVQKYTKQIDTEKATDYTITIPKEITKKIDFIENLEIIIYLRNSTYLGVFNKTGGGGSYLSVNDRLINNKIENGKIELLCYCYRGFLSERSLTNSLIHEINHYYDAYNDLKKHPNYVRMIKQLRKSNIRNNVLFDDAEINNLFLTILYRLFSETEFNALVSSVYGDLMGFHSKRENFQRDVKETQAYYHYKNILSNYKYVYSFINETNYIKIKDFLDSIGVNINPYYDNYKGFVTELSRKTKFLLEKLIRGIGKAASVYYDESEQEEKKEQIPETIIINNKEKK